MIDLLNWSFFRRSKKLSGNSVNFFRSKLSAKPSGVKKKQVRARKKMEDENDLNLANSQNGDISFMSQSKFDGQRSEDQRKQTRKSYRNLMETTAKFDEIEPTCVRIFS